MVHPMKIYSKFRIDLSTKTRDIPRQSSKNKVSRKTRLKFSLPFVQCLHAVLQTSITSPVLRVPTNPFSRTFSKARTSRKREEKEKLIFFKPVYKNAPLIPLCDLFSPNPRLSGPRKFLELPSPFSSDAFLISPFGPLALPHSERLPGSRIHPWPLTLGAHSISLSALFTVPPFCPPLAILSFIRRLFFLSFNPTRNRPLFSFNLAHDKSPLLISVCPFLMLVTPFVSACFPSLAFFPVSRPFHFRLSPFFTNPRLPPPLSLFLATSFQPRPLFSRPDPPSRCPDSAFYPGSLSEAS